MEDFTLSDFEEEFCEVVKTLEKGSVTEHSICFSLDFLIQENRLPLGRDFFGVKYRGIAFGIVEKKAIVSKVLQVLAPRPVHLSIDALKRALVDEVVNIFSVSL